MMAGGGRSGGVHALFVLQNERVTESVVGLGRLPLTYYKKHWKARQCVLKKTLWETMSVKSKVQ